MSWTLARRMDGVNPSLICEMMKLAEQPGVISFGGGLPSAAAFPVAALRQACDRVLTDTPREALQYASSEGFGPLREWVAADVAATQGLRVDASQVLITTGSQQALDLIGKLLIDPGSRVLVESPTYLGALDAFTPMEPRFVGVPADEDGPRVEALAQAAPDARFFYLLPNFQNPSGRSIGAARRLEIADRAAALGLPLVEDNPYGDLWFDAPPPPSLASRHPEAALYLGSFSKVLVPGVRLGYVIAPRALGPKLLQAKQAADLNTPGFNQRVVHEVVRNGFLDTHVAGIRRLYQGKRDAMLAALQRHMPAGVRWNRPGGGMFLWLELPGGLNALDLLPRAVERGVAYVPGAPFYVSDARTATLRLSFVTASDAEIETGIAALGEVFTQALSEVQAPQPRAPSA